MSKIKANAGGFTIVELLISIAISALFIAGVSAMLTNNARLAQRDRDASVVNSYSENKIEELRSIGYLGLNAAGAPVDITSELPVELQAPRNASLTITQQSTSVKKAVLSITYNDVGKPKTQSYATFIGELGVGQY